MSSSVVANPTFFAEDLILRDFPLRSLTLLAITNRHGSVSVESWPGDRIRVRVSAKITAPSPFWRALQDGVSVKHEQASKREELRIESRFLRSESRGDVLIEPEIQVLAPRQLALLIAGGTKSIGVKNWRSPIEIRSLEGGVELSDLDVNKVEVQCGGCGVRLTDSRVGNLSVVGASQGVVLSRVGVTRGFLDSDFGDVRVSGVKGDWMVSIQKGTFSGEGVQGSLDLRIDSGKAEIHGFSGDMNGVVRRGDLIAHFDKMDQRLGSGLEVGEGLLSVRMEPGFSGQVNSFYSERVEVLVDGFSDFFKKKESDRLSLTKDKEKGVLFLRLSKGQMKVEKKSKKT